MKKIFIILLIAISTTGYANIEAIDFSKFPDDQQFRDEVNQLSKIAMYVDHYMGLTRFSRHIVKQFFGASP